MMKYYKPKGKPLVLMDESEIKKLMIKKAKKVKE